MIKDDVNGENRDDSLRPDEPLEAAAIIINTTSRCPLEKSDFAAILEKSFIIPICGQTF
jgi:hypothetical protein